jgi:hypothetical protein
MRKSASLFSLPLGVVSRAKELGTNKTPVRSNASAIFISVFERKRRFCQV